MRAGSYLYADPNNMVLDGLIRDDSWWYINIATQGYNIGDVPSGVQGNVAFFPLYPLLVKMATALTGNVFLAGVLVANVALLFALGHLFALVRREWGEDTAARAVFYLAAAPTAMFFSAMYTESLYLALVIATFNYANQRQWDRAALMGALAAATRNTGIVLAVAIALEGCHQYGVVWRPAHWGRAALWSHVRSQFQPVLRSWPALLAAGCVPLGLLAYMAYLANAFGDPFAFIHVQAAWGRATPGGAALTQLLGTVRTDLHLGNNLWAGQFDHKTLLDVLMTLVFLPLALLTVRLLRPTYSVYTLLTFLIPLATGSLGSMTRYVLMLVPCFILLAVWGRRAWVDRLVLGLFLPLLGYFTIMFCHWYFAG